MKKQLFFLKNKCFRTYALKAYNEAIQFEYLTNKEKRDSVFLLQKKIISTAYNNTKFYKKYYDSKGFHPDMLLTPNDWDKVPILEKEMIRQHTNDFLTKGVSVSEMNTATTGGSTGKPLKVYKDKSLPIEVLSWRTLKWWNIDPSINRGTVHRAVPRSFKQKIRNYLLWWPTKRIFLDATNVTEANIATFVKLINKRKVKVLVGYCGSLEKIADYIIKQSINVEGLKMVWSTTSPLAKPVRLKMEKAFQCSIMDQYGSIEVFHIAVQKPNENYLTVNADYVHVDIVDAHNHIINEIQEMGDVLVTDLHSAKFPLIKYRLGDRSSMIKTMETSEDGFPKINFVKGRISDAIYFEDDSYLDGAFLTTVCDGFEDVIDSYQVYQKLDYSLILRIVPVKGIPRVHPRIQVVINKFEEFTKDKIKFNTEFVKNISDDNGKRRFIISEIALMKQRKFQN